MTDLQREFNRQLLDLVEDLSGASPVDRKIGELRELLLTMELTDKLKATAPKPNPIDWWKVLPILLTIALLLAAIVAALLGVDLGRLL